MDPETTNRIDKSPEPTALHRFTRLLVLYLIYIAGIAAFLVIISDPFTMSTYFSDNSLLPGLVNREFSLGIEAEYYYKDLTKLSKAAGKDALTLATSPSVSEYIKKELDNFGLDAYEQTFNHKNNNGTNIYSIISAERSTNSESIVLCAPYKVDKETNTLAGVSLTLAMAKYFSTKSYWAKDVIILFVDQNEFGTSAWIDSYYDVNFKRDLHNHKGQTNKDSVHYDSLKERSGPIQAAIVLDLNGTKFSKVNVKIQGMYGQLPNLDLFNLVIELAARELVTPYFYGKSLPFDLSTGELFQHHFETALEFMKSQASMQSDGLHGLFLQYAVQSLTLEGPKFEEDPNTKSRAVTASLLNVGRLVEGVFRSLNNLTERFNRSYYFYIILSLRRFTSIGYYMISFGLMVAPILLKAYITHGERVRRGQSIGFRTIVLLIAGLILALLSTFNISSAIISAVVSVPILLLI